MPVKTTAGLNRFTEFLIIWLLRKVGQPWSEKFFRAAKRLFCMTAIEVIIVRFSGHGIEVLLTLRPDNDPDWPSQLHSPGSMLRNTDAGGPDDYEKVNERVLAEIGLRTFSKYPILIDGYPIATRRGAENANIFIGEIEGLPVNGKFYPLDLILEMPVDVPGGLIPEHLHMLRRIEPKLRRAYPLLRSLYGG